MDNNEYKDPLENPAFKEDALITVVLSLRDYKILREILEDRKSTTRFIGKWKTFVLALSGTVAAFYFLGEKILKAISIKVGGG